MSNKRIPRKALKGKTIRIFRNQHRANIAAMEEAGGTLAERLAAMLRQNRNSEAIPFDGTAPDDSGDESTQEARNGLPPTA